MLVAIVLTYQAIGVITPAQKDAYNVLTTIIILILGLSFFVCLLPMTSHYHMKDIDLSMIGGLQAARKGFAGEDPVLYQYNEER